jgi:uncharacterized integral membrane protein (TIGR00701 family)
MLSLAATKGWLVTAHLVGAIGWLGGLILLVRVLRYHADEPPSARPTLSRLEKRINWTAAIPSAVLSIAAGVLLVRQHGVAWLRTSFWMQAKLALVLVLLISHLGVTRAQRRIARLDANAPLSRAPFGALALGIGLLLVAIVALSVHTPRVDGR